MEKLAFMFPQPFVDAFSRKSPKDRDCPRAFQEELVLGDLVRMHHGLPGKELQSVDSASGRRVGTVMIFDWNARRRSLMTA